MNCTIIAYIYHCILKIGASKKTYDANSLKDDLSITFTSPLSFPIIKISSQRSNALTGHPFLKTAGSGILINPVLKLPLLIMLSLSSSSSSESHKSRGRSSSNSYLVSYSSKFCFYRGFLSSANCYYTSSSTPAKKSNLSFSF